MSFFINVLLPDPDGPQKMIGFTPFLEVILEK